MPDDRTSTVHRAIQAVRGRPVLAVACAILAIASAVSYGRASSAHGSADQAEQLVLAWKPSPASEAASGGAATVSCSQNGQGFAARLFGMFRIADRRTSHIPQTDERWTHYTCDGTSTGGQPMRWCVAFPPDRRFGREPEVAALAARQSC